MDSSRLILSSAKTLQVTLTRGGQLVDSQTLTLQSGTATYTYSAKLEVRVPHLIAAKAFDASGAAVFEGSANVVLFGDRSLTLYLLPVKADGSAWPTLAAADQPPSGIFPPQPFPPAGTSLTYRIDFGSTGAGFSFAPFTGANLYLQNLDGSRIEPVPSTVTPALLGGQTAFWATYDYQSPGTLGSVGSFFIPLTGLSLPASYEIGQGAAVNLSPLLVKSPLNQTDGAVEWLVGDFQVATIDALSGMLTAGVPSSTPATTLVTVRKSDGTLPATMSLTVWGPEFSRLADLTVEVDGVSQPLSFVPGTTTYTLSAESKTATQSLELTPTAGASGQTLAWSSDQAVWNAMTTTQSSTIVLVQGTNNVWVKVTAPNGVETTTYQLTIQKSVLPTSLSLSPASLSMAIDEAPSIPFTPVFTLAQTDNKAVTWRVDRTDLADIDEASGVVTPLASGTVTVTAKSSADQSLEASATLELTPSQAQLKDATLAGLAVSVDNVAQGLVFAPATLNYPLADAQSTTATQILTLTATEAMTGQTLEGSLDGTTWTALVTDVGTNLTLVKGPNTVQVRVTALNGTDTKIYQISVNKIVMPALLTLTPTAATLATDATPAAFFTVAFDPPETSNLAVTWSVSPPGLATIDTNGVLTPLLPGDVTVTATSAADNGVSGTAILTLTPSQYRLKATDGAFWTELTASPVQAPSGTLAIAGNDTTLWALGPAGTLKVFNGGVWTTSGLTAPSGTQWFGVDSKGLVVCATPTRVIFYDAGFWSSAIPVPPVGIQGLVMGDKGVIIWGTDGNLWSFENALWTKMPITLPVGTLAVVGGSSLTAVTATQIRDYQSGFWSLMPVAPLPQTVSSTFALGHFVSLIVK